MKIQFNSIDDFIEDLRVDREKIERGIVRVNFLTKPLNSTPNVRRQFLIAQCIISGHVVALERYLGDIWGIGETDEKTHEKGDELRAALINKLRGMGLEIRGGMIEETA